MSRLLAATLALSAVSMAHVPKCVPIGPDAPGDAVVGPKYRKAVYGDQDVHAR
jgi:hypothetical protein